MEDDRPKPCTAAKQKLLDCVLKSDCYLKYGHSPRECLKAETQGYDPECRPLAVSFYECKRSLLDNRQRFRGRKGD